MDNNLYQPERIFYARTMKFLRIISVKLHFLSFRYLEQIFPIKKNNFFASIKIMNLKIYQIIKVDDKNFNIWKVRLLLHYNSNCF